MVSESEIKSKTLVLGRGFVGKEFERYGFTVKDRSYVNVDEIIEGTYSKVFIEELLDGKYDNIVNCIGISDTRYCEDKNNWLKVQTINGDFVRHLSNICKFYGKKFVHISTGCLYENTQGLKYENGKTETHCNYTVSKMIGELHCNKDDLILRPRLLFNKYKDPKNLLYKLEKFNKFLNEFNTVCSTEEIVNSTIELLKRNLNGVYNIGNTGTYTISQLADAFRQPEWYEVMDQHELICSQKLHLVNNVMSLDKLIDDTGYIPKDAFKEIRMIADKGGLQDYDSDK